MVYVTSILIVFILPHVSGQINECHRTNCEKTEGVNGYHITMKRLVDQKITQLTPTLVIKVSGDTQEERERNCVKSCKENGTAVCKSANLSPFVDSLPSDCTLFDKDVYYHSPNDIANLRETNVGWTTFHLFVSHCILISSKYSSFVFVF